MDITVLFPFASLFFIQRLLICEDTACCTVSLPNSRLTLPMFFLWTSEKYTLVSTKLCRIPAGLESRELVF